MPTPSVVDEVAEVVAIATIFSLSAVLSYPPTLVVVGKTPVAAS
jgi:hypothetical protein